MGAASRRVDAKPSKVWHEYMPELSGQGCVLLPGGQLQKQFLSFISKPI